MDTGVIHEAMAESQAGSLIFPEVVRRLLAGGVESYFVDFAKGEMTFYALDGTTHVEKVVVLLSVVVGEFSLSRVMAAIRGAQTDTVRYPEFVTLAIGAGVIGYWAFLTGKKVIYFGRKGEAHVEEFPGPKA
jgi:uncharacterized protein YbcV (DUF1398 family)